MAHAGRSEGMLPCPRRAAASRHAANPLRNHLHIPRTLPNSQKSTLLATSLHTFEMWLTLQRGGQKSAHTVGAHGAAADWPDRTAAMAATCTVTCLTRAASAGRAAAGCGRRGLGGHLHGVRRRVRGAGEAVKRGGARHAQPARLWARQHPPDTTRGPAALCGSGRGRSGQQPDRRQLPSACRNGLPLACNCASCHRDAGGVWGTLRAAGRVRAVRGLVGGAPLGAEAGGGADLAMACRVGFRKHRSGLDSAGRRGGRLDSISLPRLDLLHIEASDNRSRCWRALCISSVSLLAAAPRPGWAIGPAPPLINQWEAIHE